MLKTLFSTILFTLCLFVAPLCHAQITATTGPGGRIAFAPVTAVGPLTTSSGTANVITHQNGSAAPSSHTIDWSNDGTAAAVCTFQLEGSTDKVHWYSLTGSQVCTTGNMIHVTPKPVIFLRINILTYTAGDVTTVINFNYTKGQ